jgi:3-hydroxybutyryl-CoA dehydratase
MAAGDLLHFEDIEIGRVYLSAGRTITVADIVNFAGVSGDFAELHMSDDLDRGSELAARETGIGSGRIAHGLLGLVVQSALGGQAVRTAGVAFLGLTWQFRHPILPGDPLYVRLFASDKRLSESRPGTGIVKWSREVLNQHGDVVQDGETVLLVRTRAGGERRGDTTMSHPKVRTRTQEA